MNSYYNYLYGTAMVTAHGYYNNYENYYDPDKYVKLFGASVGWGKRLRWPDDYFTLSMSLAFTRYMLKNWNYFLITTGNSNNLNFSISLNRSSTDNQLFPRRGSEFMASVTLTPPWSKWDNKDYEQPGHRLPARPPTTRSSRRNTAGLNTTSGSSRHAPSPHSPADRSASC